MYTQYELAVEEAQNIQNQARRWLEDVRLTGTERDEIEKIIGRLIVLIKENRS